MHLTRRDFAKTGLGGLLGSVLALWPGKAKAEHLWRPEPWPGPSKPEPKFPRYFVPTRGSILPYVYVEWRGKGSVIRVRRDGRACPMAWSGFEKAVESGTRTGHWREVAVNEARALLKPKRIVVWKSTACGFSEADPFYANRLGKPFQHKGR